MTPSILAKIEVIKQETGIGANTKLRIGEVLREIANEKPYKVYTAILTQTGTNDPIVVELENTLEEVVTWQRVSTGYYVAVISAINESTSLIRVSNQTFSGSSKDIKIQTDLNNGQVDIIVTKNGTTPIDEELNNTPVEIRIYN